IARSRWPWPKNRSSTPRRISASRRKSGEAGLEDAGMLTCLGLLPRRAQAARRRCLPPVDCRRPSGTGFVTPTSSPSVSPVRLSRPVAAVVFDMDGTLLDTEAVHRITMQAAAQALGHDLPDALFAELIGVHRDVNTQTLLDHFGESFPIESFYRDA